MRKSQSIDFNEDKTNESAGIRGLAVQAGHAERMKKHVLAPMKKQLNCLEKEIMQGTMRGARRRGRPRTAYIDNIKTWTRLNQNDRGQR